MSRQIESNLLDTKEIYEFDCFRVDPLSRLLLRDGEVVPLTSKIFDILLLLVENSGRVLEKDEVMRKVWQGSFVEESNLARNIPTLRKALGEDTKSPQYILTIHGHGYKFATPVRKLQCPVAPEVAEMQTISTTIIEEEINLPDDFKATRARRQTPRSSRTVFTIACLVMALPLIAITLPMMVNKWLKLTASRLPDARPSPQLIKFTATGNSGIGSISPDGKFTAYVVHDHGKRQSLWVKQMVSGSSVCVLPAVDLSYWGLTFSPDSNFLYYVIGGRPPFDGGALYRMPILGGTAEKLLTGISTHPSFSPDGRQIVFRRPLPGKQELIIADADGRRQQVWATGSSPYDFWGYDWSSQGQTIAYANSREDEGGRYWYIAEMPVTGGAENVISKRRYKPIRGMDWLPDGEGLVVVADDPTTGLFQLWHLSRDGTERRLTNDVLDYWTVSVTADGSSLLTAQQERQANIFVASMTDPRQARQVTSGVGSYDTLTWAPADRIIYSEFRNGVHDIWAMEADGSGQKRLTANAGHNKFPDISAHGQHILFVSNRGGLFRAWRMETDGSNARQIGGETTGRVQSSPDGQQAFYSSNADGGWALWRVSLNDGKPERMRDLYSYRASISPDGKLLAYTYMDESLGRVRLAISPIDSSTPIRTFDAHMGYEVIRWVDNGKAVAYISGNHEIHIQDIAGGVPRVLLTVPEVLFSFDLSHDGKQIAYISGRITHDLILVRNF